MFESSNKISNYQSIATLINASSVFYGKHTHGVSRRIVAQVEEERRLRKLGCLLLTNWQSSWVNYVCRWLLINITLEQRGLKSCTRTMAALNAFFRVLHFINSPFASSFNARFLDLFCKTMPRLSAPVRLPSGSTKYKFPPALFVSISSWMSEMV